MGANSTQAGLGDGGAETVAHKHPPCWPHMHRAKEGRVREDAGGDLYTLDHDSHRTRLWNQRAVGGKGQ